MKKASHIFNKSKGEEEVNDIINKNNLSFHHLIIPHRDCRTLGLGEGYLEWNGAILNQNTSHDYLH